MLLNHIVFETFLVYYSREVKSVGKVSEITDCNFVGAAGRKYKLFRCLYMLLSGFGFTERIKGDHHIFTMSCIEEILNIQPDGNKAKPYQVKQIRNLMLRYKLGGKV